MNAAARLLPPPPPARVLHAETPPHPLRDRLAAAIAEGVDDLLEPRRIEALAKDLRVVERDRVHHIGLVVDALVLSSFARQDDNGGRWLDAGVIYRELGGPSSSPKSFRTVCRKARRVLQSLFRRGLRRLGRKSGSSALRGRLEAFADVLVPDGCAFKLASALAGYWPGTGNPAELKLHAVYRVSTGLADVSFSAGRVHDNDGFKPTSWEANALYIWDLGYNDTDRFVDAALAGAIPLQRLKSGANPVVLATVDADGTRRTLAWENRSAPVRLNDACEHFVPPTGPLDLDVELRSHDGRRVVARVVCVPFEGEDRYYLTTLPRCTFTPFDVAEIYRLRWEVELLFKSWKGATRLDNVHRLRHPESIEAHVWACLVAVVLGREIHAELERANEPPQDPAVARVCPFIDVASGGFFSLR